MKKLFTVLAVLLVATALFAGITVKAGGTFAFERFNSPVNAEEPEYFPDNLKLRMHGFGFEAGIQYDLADNLAVYGEFSMVFPKDAEAKIGDADWVKVSDFEYDEDATLKFNFFSISAGLAYKLDFDAVKLAVGAGVTLNRSSFKANYKIADNIDGEDKLVYTNIGLNALVDAKYMFTENIGVGVTLNPQLGLYSFGKDTFKESDDPDPFVTKAHGFKIGFAMPITVGVSYIF